MRCNPSIGVESGCQLVPEASRDMEYGPNIPGIDIDIVSSAIQRAPARNASNGKAAMAWRDRTGGNKTLYLPESVTIDSGAYPRVK